MKTMFVKSENINKTKKFKKPNILRKKTAVSFAKPSTTLSDSTFIDIGRVTDATVKNAEESNQSMVNIDAFFNDTAEKNVMLYDVDYESGSQMEMKCYGYRGLENKSPINNLYIEENQELLTNAVPLSSIKNGNNESIGTELAQNNYTFSATVRKYKCDVHDCKKEFRSEQKLQKHKKVHNEDGSIKPARQVTVGCPVKKVAADGTEYSCGKLFLVRELLLKHLNEDHTSEDASYKCEECDRRFFWLSGVRAHARSHSQTAGPVLVCGWSGCGRVFRQPCRLREHARAHTGDRPYHCTFPNCGGSFRSASKLERHSRRHTGVRRYKCSECSRAFLRRDHLRDHHARHHAQRSKAHHCNHPGCEQTFNSMNRLFMHLKKVHSIDASASEAANIETVALAKQKEEDSSFLVDLVSESALVTESADMALSVECVIEESSGDCGGDGEWRAARTHCTWPLPRITVVSEAAAASPTPNATIDDDYAVEQQSENSESNIYTIRSDLFLHGNVMINEDSEQSSSAVGGTSDPMDADLGILDAHPTGDLMQEELMYTDVATDESSFRIFLLSGEELT